jgi:hypothetical protein
MQTRLQARELQVQNTASSLDLSAAQFLPLSSTAGRELALPSGSSPALRSAVQVHIG